MANHLKDPLMSLEPAWQVVDPGPSPQDIPTNPGEVTIQPNGSSAKQTGGERCHGLNILNGRSGVYPQASDLG